MYEYQLPEFEDYENDPTFLEVMSGVDESVPWMTYDQVTRTIRIDKKTIPRIKEDSFISKLKFVLYDAYGNYVFYDI